AHPVTNVFPEPSIFRPHRGQTEFLVFGVCPQNSVPTSPSERCPETQLEHARLVSEIVAEGRFAVIRRAFDGCILTVIGVIEHVEHLEDAEKLDTVTN